MEDKDDRIGEKDNTLYNIIKRGEERKHRRNDIVNQRELKKMEENKRKNEEEKRKCEEVKRLNRWKIAEAKENRRSKMMQEIKRRQIEEVYNKQIKIAMNHFESSLKRKYFRRLKNICLTVREKEAQADVFYWDVILLTKSFQKLKINSQTQIDKRNKIADENYSNYLRRISFSAFKMVGIMSIFYI